MKYIILPLLKIIMMLFVFYFYILAYCAAFIFGLWDFKFKENFKYINDLDFYVQSTPVKSGEQYYVYERFIDWFKNNKIYRTKN